MKKLASLLTAALLTVGLVAFSGGSPASAGYPGQLKTTTRANAPAQVPVGKIRPIHVNVGSPGARNPRGGTVDVIIRHNGHVVKFVERRYHRGFTAWTPRSHRTGRYVVVVHFLPAAGSSYRFSTSRSHYRVTR